MARSDGGAEKHRSFGPYILVEDGGLNVWFPQEQGAI